MLWHALCWLVILRLLKNIKSPWFSEPVFTLQDVWSQFLRISCVMFSAFDTDSPGVTQLPEVTVILTVWITVRVG